MGARLRWLCGVLLLACANEGSAWPRQGARDDDSRMREAASAVRVGKYDDAIAIYTELANKSGGPVEAPRKLVRVLAEVGKYAEAEDVARKLAAPGLRGAQAQNALGEALYARGKLADAEAAFTAAMQGRASDSLTARLNLAVLHYERGDRDVAMREFDHYIDVYNDRRGRLTAEELLAVGAACRYLGGDTPALFKDALKAYDAAAALDTVDLEPRVREAELFLEKYNGADAKTTVDAILAVNPKHPRALLAAAKRASFDGDPKAGEFARQSLAANPNLVGGRAFQAQALLDLEDYDGASKEAEQALQTNPASSEALALLAVARWLKGDTAGFAQAKQRAFARNPRDAEFFATLAEASARNRLYAEAAEFAREGTMLDAKSWHAWGVLGMNLLRTGKITEGKASLDKAFAADPYDVWIKNTLDLVDTYKDYREVTSGRFLLVIENKDADLLSPYLAELGEEAYDKLAERYGYKPPTPIRLEVYRSHADFSVRTVGLAGLGALGVSFGTTLAMDSPAARDAGEFNWGSTFWHELAHTFTLGASGHRVPRWLSEGLSVYEERRARQGWGADISPEFLAAYDADMLVKVSRMNDGFMRPAYPQQIIFSYYQASLVCELIERDFGAKALPDMLRGYKDGLTTPQVFQRVLKTDPEALDKRFDAYLKQRFGERMKVVKGSRPDAGAVPVLLGGRGRGGGPSSGPQVKGEFADAMRSAIEAYGSGSKESARPLFEKAKAMFPEFADEHSAYWYLSQLDKEKGDLRAAAAELTTMTSRNESAMAANVELASVLSEVKDAAGEAAALDRTMYIQPFDGARHARLATLAATLGDRKKAVRERRAVVALAPTDRAEALYQLALAYFESGDAAAARREVLRALEEAPNFDKAQELLLQVQSKRPPSGRDDRGGGKQ